MATCDNDLEPVVLDNGTWMCKAGYAGDKTAQVYERTLVGKATSETSPEFIGENACIQRDLLELSYPMCRGLVTDWDVMERCWEYVFRRKLRAGIDGRSMLITEIPGAPPDHRRHVTEILMEKFQVPALYISNPAYLALLASGRTTGAVLEVGGDVAHTAVAIRGSEVKEANKRSDIGGNDVTTSLLTSLRDRGGRPFTNQDQVIIGDALKHHMTSWIASKSDPNRSNEYSFTDGTCITVDEHLSKCFDVLFDPSMIGSDAIGIDQLLYDVINSSDPTVKSTICSNIILAGGATIHADIAERVRCRLAGHGSCITQDLKVIAPPERRKSAWLGGSIFAGLEEFPTLCKTQQMYHESGWREFLTFKESETILQAES